MKHLVSPVAAALGAAMLLSATPALAQTPPLTAAAHAEVRNITIELIDLKPDDGIDPWITWTNETQLVGASRRLPYASERLETTGEAEVAGDWGRAYASNTRIDLLADSRQSSTLYGQEYSGGSSRTDFFTLSPWTAVRATASGSINAFRGAGSTASAGIHLHLLLSNPPFGMPDLDMDSYEYATHGNGSWDLSVLVGSGSEAKTGLLYSYARTATSTVTAVPEPATYAMLLAGLGLVGAAARRRRRG